MLPYRDTTPLERLVEQLNKYGVTEKYIAVFHGKEEVKRRITDENATFIEKQMYFSHSNCYDMYLCFKSLIKSGIDDVVIFEGDMLGEDELINYITGTDFENKTIWFTDGKFKKGQYGGILRYGIRNNVTNIKVVDGYNNGYKGYDKLTGILRISKTSVTNAYNSLLDTTNFYGYYLKPWTRDLKKLGFERGDISHYLYRSFNNLEEYEEAISINYDPVPEERPVRLIDIDDLHPIEGYDTSRFGMIDFSVGWKVPIRIEQNFNIILDGNHRFWKAKKGGLKRVPALLYDYDEVDMWPLRPPFNLTKRQVIDGAISGNVLDFKTAKHRFPPTSFVCDFSLEELS